MAKRKKSKRRASSQNLPIVSKEPVKNGERAFPIVGIGASAGGLKAFEQFFSNMPANSGAAFVLVSHLDPTHASLLPELLRKYTDMEVFQARDGMKVCPNSVHVIPPNNEMVIMHGTLLLKRPRESRGLRLPIDTFFNSLAEDQGHRAVCIILSGNGTDGTLGLRAIKAELGFAIVQEPRTAEYDSMPRSAIGSGLVDVVLAPDKMPERLLNYLRHFVSRRFAASAPSAEADRESLLKIFQLLRARTGHDFSLYKRNTLYRRIQRRLRIHQIERLTDYVDYLGRNPQELVTLFKEFLIGVTNFFRDPQAFAALADLLRSELLAAKPKETAIRVWIPGCSTGEEVYSVAIMLRECMEKLKRTQSVQIFATDIDSDAIDTARAGLYPASIAADVEPERLKRFFVPEAGAYRIKKEIREMTVFAIQDVLKDAPFTKIDLLSCRNLLIYLDPEAQKRLLPLFHYALNPEGLLFLGTSESINGFTNLFTLADRKWKIFKRRPGASGAEVAVQFLPATAQSGAVDGRQPARADPVSRLAQSLLIENYAPPCVFIDRIGQVLYTHGRTGKYLELAQGQVNLNLLEMVREGLRHELAAAIRKARTQRRKVMVEALQVKTNGGSQNVTVKDDPVPPNEGKDEVMKVALEELAPKSPAKGKSKARVSPSAARRISQVEQELKYTQENLQSTIEELETSNEEMKSANEELQSTNEELQSTNEEMETSKEEMQSLNEELVTVNAELQGKIEELSHANDDMKNLLDSTKIATIFLDNNLRIKRFTSEAPRLINLIPSDVGRPIAHIVTKLEMGNLVSAAQEVIDSLISKEELVRSKDGRWYLSRIIPYRTMDNVIDGVVMTFTDITEQKAAESAVIAARDLAEGIVETVRDPLLALNRNLVVMAANSAFHSFFKTSPREIMGKRFFELGDGQWDTPPLRELMENVLPRNTQIEAFNFEHVFPVIGRRHLSINARRIHREGVGTETILLMIREITDGE